MPRHKSMSSMAVPGDQADRPEDKFGHVLSKINRFLRQQFVLPESPLNLKMVMEEKSRKQAAALAQEKEKTAKNQLMAPTFEESEDSATKKEALKQEMAERMTKPPSIKFYDSKIFETDLKYFREWFRLHERENRDKFDYFYGPLDPDDQRSRDINRKRLERVKKRLAQPALASRPVRYSLSYSPPKRYDRPREEKPRSTLQRYDVAIADDAKPNESSTDQDQNDYGNFFMNFEEP